MFGRRRSKAPAQEPAATGTIHHLDDQTFFDGTADGLTVVDFWAEWCAPCKVFAPAFASTAADYEGRVRFAKLNVDQSPRSAGLVGIQSIPTLVLFDGDGNEVRRLIGAVPPKALRRFLDDVLEARVVT